ncbi:NepR family anti-sigma factor [Novosphingobium aureum]|nr:NepR family anti-sigma factor [Novosphingobium aureum]
MTPHGEDRIERLIKELALSQPKSNGETGRMPGLPPEVRRDGEPGWAGGLRKLYNSVVDEPLPDSFKDLLKKLDDSGDA